MKIAMQAAEQRVAVVTGATRGIGKAIAQALAQSGHQVVITGRSDGVPVVDAIRKQGGAAHYIALDVSNEIMVENCFKEVVLQFGTVNVLVNNAGIAKDSLLLRGRSEDWREMLAVNFVGTLLCSRAALKQMIRNQWGRIINISSVVGLIGNPGQSVYAGCKAGLIGITKSLAKEVGSRQVTVNAIAPGFIETEMTSGLSDKVREEYLRSIPLGRLGTSAEVAAVAAFLASDQAGYITGQVIGVNGGMA